MAFEYKGYKIEREDAMNVCLYRWSTVQVSVNGKRTGETREEWKNIGYFNTFLGAARRLYDYLLEDGKDIAELKAIVAGFNKDFDFVALKGAK